MIKYEHKSILRGQLLRRLPEADQSSLCECVINEEEIDLVLNFIFLQFKSSTLSIASFLSTLSAKLHRNLPIQAINNVSRFLFKLQDEFSELDEAIVHIVNVFPDLFVPLTNLFLSKGNPEFIENGLEIWLKEPMCSPNLSEIEFLRHICYLLQFLDFPEQLLCNLIVRIDPNIHLQEKFDLVVQLFLVIRQRNVTFSRKFGLTLTELILRIKSSNKSWDCSLLINFLKDLVSDYDPMYLVTLSHPIFNSEEAYLGVSLFNQLQSDIFTKASSLMILADYPTPSPHQEHLLGNILSAPIISYNIKEDGSDHFSLVMSHVLSVGLEKDFEPIDLGDELYSYAQFFRLFVQILKGKSSNIFSLVEITRRYPKLAQRLFLCISIILRDGSCRGDLVQIVEALTLTCSIDGFCHDRSINLLRLLLQSSNEVKALLLPILSEKVSNSLFLFPLVNEFLPSLIFGNAKITKVAISAYCASLYALSFNSTRQSILTFVFSSVQGVLKGMGKTVVEFDPKPKALLFKTLLNLVKVLYLSPKLAWKELIPKDETDLEVTNVIAEIAGSLSMVVPSDEEEYSKVDPIVNEAVQYLLKLFEKNPTAALLGLIRYPIPFTSSLEIMLVDKFKTLAYPAMEVEEIDTLATFVKEWVSLEIKSMPRSLYLGTSSFMDISKNTASPSTRSNHIEDIINTKITNWVTNPTLACIKLRSANNDSLKEFQATLLQLPNLPNITLQHWIIRFELLSSLKNYISRTLQADNSEADDFTLSVKSISGSLIDRMKQAQTINVVSYSLLVYSILISVASSIEKDFKIAYMTFCEIMESSYVDKRFKSNEDFIAAQQISLDELYSVFDNHHKLIVQNDFDGFKSKLKPKEGGWLWMYLNYQQLWSASSPDDAIEEEEFSKYQQQSFQVDKAEPINMSGSSWFSLGRRAANMRPLSVKIIEGQIDNLCSNALTMKKMDSVYFFSGLLVGVNKPNMSESMLSGLSDKLTKALQGITDLRFASWLLLLLRHSSLGAGRDGDATPLSPSGASVICPVNRFGPESPFGNCLDILYDSNCGRNLHLAILKGLKDVVGLLPRLDWSWLLGKVEYEGQLVELSWKQHPHSSQLFDFLLGGITRGLTSIKNDQLVPLITAVYGRPEAAKKLLACLETCLIQDYNLLRVFASSDLSVFDQSDLSNFIQNIADYDILSTWYKANNTTAIDEDVSLLVRQRDIDLGLELYIKEPSKIALVASTFASIPNVLSELSNSFLLAMEYDPAIIPAISSLFLKTLKTKSSKLINDSGRLSWWEFKLKDPIAAEKIERKLSSIDYLLPDSLNDIFI